MLLDFVSSIVLVLKKLYYQPIPIFLMASIYTYSCPVMFVQTDVAGVAHFSHYFSWMEAAEHAFLQSLSLPILEHSEGKLRGWPKLKASALFQVPLQFGDAVEVDLVIQELTQRTISYCFQFFRVLEGVRTPVGTGEMTTCYAEKTQDGAAFLSVAIPTGVIAAVSQWRLL